MIFVVVVLGFVLSYGVYGLATTNFHFTNDPTDFDSDERNIKLFGLNFSKLAGTMCLGYYLHNLSLPIIKNNPTHQTRNVFIGYFLVFVSYISAGALGYIGFSGK